jgi:hypothetical protein
MQILSACTAGSDLELIVNELTLETLTREDGGKVVFEHIYKTYKECIELSMTKHLEAALYSEQCKRNRGETLLSYTARWRILFRYLDSAGIRLPAEAKGYLLMRDSKAWDTCTTWTKGSYDYDVIIDCLRMLERPIPGHGGHTATNLGRFVEAETFAEYTDPAESFCGICGSDGNHEYEHE